MNKQEFLKAIERSKNVYFNEHQLLKLVGANINYDTNTLKYLIDLSIKSGELILTERHKLVLLSKSGVLKGVFDSNAKGFGFVKVEGREQDIFIPEKKVNGAVHGDIVLVRLTDNNFRVYKNRQNKRAEGEIVTIVERKIVNVVGLFIISAGGAVVIPDDRRFTDQIFIAQNDINGARPNEKVVVKIKTYPSRNQMAIGQVIEILGDVNSIGVDTLSIIRSFGLYENFDEKVMAEAKSVAKEPTKQELAGRKNYSKDLVITIDGEDAKDFDDAISLKKDETGYDLNVHIADVSHYVKQGGLVDEEAFKRATSVYFPDHVLPMIPECLSNNVCSLNPNVLRLTLSVQIRFDLNGNIKNYEINNGYIKSAYRMTYTKVTKIFEGDEALCKEYNDLLPMLNDMKELALLLIKRRESAGELDFNLPEVQIVMDDNNKIADIKRKPRNLSDRLIEQFMVVTNEVVARHMKNMGAPFIYRVHEVPTEQKMATFNDFIKGIGLNLTLPQISPKPKDVQKAILAVKNKPMEVVVNSILLRSMQKAKYYQAPLGHFGLALADYCHFTSPIRRYPDLVIHRIIKLYLSDKMNKKDYNFYNDFVAIASKQSSERERLADEAERTVDDLKKAEYMTRFIGQEFVGYISGVTENGVFVQLDNTCEGMVRVEDLPQDKYYYDEAKFAIIGKNNVFKIGQKLKIKVFATDLITRKIDFVLANDFLCKN